MENIIIETEFIKLSQLLKLANLVNSGAEAKVFIADGKVKVNSEVVFEKGRKIYTGDIVELSGSKSIKVTALLL